MPYTSPNATSDDMPNLSGLVFVISTRYLTCDSQLALELSMQGAGVAWADTKTQLKTSSGRYKSLAKKYLSDSDSDSDITDIADLDTTELQQRVNERYSEYDVIVVCFY